MNLENQKEKFLLRYVFFSNSISGAFQHNHVYAKGKVDMSPEELQAKEQMKDFIFEKLQESPQFMDSEKIVNYIDELQNSITNISKYKEILREGQITFGTVQKIVNLYLKYLWVAGLLEEEENPPHCPVDGQVLKKIEWKGDSWTKMKKEDYERAIGEIANKIGGNENIAKWELENWPFSK